MKLSKIHSIIMSKEFFDKLKFFFPRKYKESEILKLIAKNPKGILVEEIIKQTKFSRSTVYRTIKSLKDSKTIYKSQDCKYFHFELIKIMHVFSGEVYSGKDQKILSISQIKDSNNKYIRFQIENLGILISKDQLNKFKKELSEILNKWEENE